MELEKAFIGFGFTLLGGLIMFILNKLWTLRKPKEEVCNGKNPCVSPNMKSAIYKTHTNVEELLEMHNVRDQNGVPIWYNPAELREAIKSNNECIARFADALGVIAKSIEKQERNTSKVINILLQERSNNG